MKALRIVFVAIVCMIITLNDGWSQSYAFMVISTKGMTEKKTGDNWQPIKIGDRLKTTDEVKIPGNGYLGLQHSSGKPLEIRNPGSYPVAELASKVGKGSSPLNKYADFILSTQQDKTTRLAATGAVHRGKVQKVQVYLPGAGKADLYSDHFMLTWSSDGSARYTVQLLTMEESELKKLETTETSLFINLKELNITTNNILFKVTSESGNVSDKMVVKKLTESRKRNLSELSNEIVALEEGTSALEKYILGNIYESKLLLIDALTAYKQAADLDPEVYQESYNQFIQRLGFKAD